MSTERETTRIVRSWLDKGVTTLPDRVLDAVLDQLPATHQRRATWWPARRFPFMNNTTVRFGIAAAAVIVLALLGLRFLPGGVGDDPRSTPTATPVRAQGALEPGTYYIDDPARTPVKFTFTVPSGWTARADTVVLKYEDQANELGFFPDNVTHVFGDACEGHDGTTLTEIGPTVDDLVRALEEQANSDASAPADVTLGGYPAKRIEMTVPPGLDTSTCAISGIQVWSDPEYTDFFAGAGGTVYIVDVDGERAVLVAGHSPGSSVADIAELDAVIGSIRFEP